MSPSHTIHPLIVGTGSLACLFAARLSVAEIPVTMLGSWPEGIAALRRDGVRLVDTDGIEKAYPVNVIQVSEDSQANLSSFPEQFAYALVLVKSWQTDRAAGILAKILAPDGLALTLQNGLGSAEILASALDTERVMQGVTSLGANMLAPGRVQIAGEGPITLGVWPRTGEFTALLQEAGFEVLTTSNLDSLLWGKLVINAAINPLTAIFRIPNGALLERPDTRQKMIAAAREAAAVATTLGIRLPYTDPITTVEAVAGRTAANRSSMLQDVERGAPTEIDAINGAVVKAGKQVGVATPINLALWQLVKGL